MINLWSRYQRKMEARLRRLGEPEKSPEPTTPTLETWGRCCHVLVPLPADIRLPDGTYHESSCPVAQCQWSQERQRGEG
jgi:hypothetical protein